MTPDWKRGWDSYSETPYTVRDASAIVYEDAQSVKAKVILWGTFLNFMFIEIHHVLN